MSVVKTSPKTRERLAEESIRELLVSISTTDLKAEVTRRELFELARDHPQLFSNKVQFAIGSGLDKKAADEVSNLAKAGKPEEAMEKLYKAPFRQIRPSTI